MSTLVNHKINPKKIVDEKENPGSKHIDTDIPQSLGSTVFKKKILGDGARRQKLVMSTAADKSPAEDLPLPVAKTMLQRHIDMLTPGAVIVVGCSGDDILRDGVMEFLSAHGIKAQPDTHNAGRIVVIQETPPLV